MMANGSVFCCLIVGFAVAYRVAKLCVFFVEDQEDTRPGVAVWRSE